MYSSANILVRLTEAEIEVGAYRIPKGWALFISLALVQRPPTLFAEPQQYDPLRFAPDRQEDHQHRFP